MSLTPELIPQFSRDGYLICRAMVSPADCLAMQAVVDRDLRQEVGPLEYEADLGYPGAPSSLAAPGGRTIRRLRGAYQRDPLLRHQAEDARIADWLALRFGETPCLTLAHHNCVMTKHPDYGTATGWHRDIRYWSFRRPDLVAVWLALGEETETNGALRVIPGSHRLDMARERLDDLDFLRTDMAENRELFEQGVTVALQPGDLLLFHSGLFHAAGRNNSTSVKRSLVFAYHGASNTALPGSRSALGGSVPLSR